MIAHVAGTNGKGSTVAFLASIARAHDYRVGVYTSPHLNDIRERIRINETLISRREFAEEVGVIKRALKHWPKNVGVVTYFEIMTALALCYFKKKNVDLTILEVGLGGRLDATNATRTSLSIFTEIGLDHERWLGSTIEKIAREKSGIIKKNVPVCSLYQKAGAERIIRLRSKIMGVPFLKIPRPRLIKLSAEKSVARINVDGTDGIKVSIPLAGKFQVNNAGLAAGAYTLLHKFYGFLLNKEAVRKGIESASWPGRFEIIRRKPVIVLDGGHNIDAARALTDSILKLFPNRKLLIIFGASRDKALEKIAGELGRLKAPVYLVSARHPRAASVQELEQRIGSFFQEAYVSRDLRLALREAGKKAGRSGVLVVTGSLFLVGEARKILCRM